MSEIFELKKVISYGHMPPNIKMAFRQIAKDADMYQDSFMFWRVGEYKDSTDEYDKQYKIIDDWLVDNMTIGDEVIFLYWW